MRRRVRKAVKSLAFFWVILAVLATNLILLMTIHYPAQSSYNEAICECGSGHAYGAHVPCWICAELSRQTDRQAGRQAGRQADR